MQDFQLVVVPMYGIANRMRAIEAGATFAEEYGCRYTVEWWREWDCNVNYEDILEPSDNFVLRERTFSSNKFVTGARKRFIKWWYTARGFAWVDDVNVLWWDHQGGRENLDPLRRIVSDDLPVPNNSRGVVLHTHRIFQRSGADRRILKPKKAILSKARDIMRRDDLPDSTYYIGVHVRRADHYHANRHSPTDAFIEAIDRKLQHYPKAIIFLATDSTEEEQKLMHHYPERLVTSGKSDWRRDSPTGVEEAMLEMLCLSLCDFIIGSYWSSFSDMAAQLGDVELEVVKVGSEVGESSGNEP